MALMPGGVRGTWRRVVAIALAAALALTACSRGGGAGAEDPTDSADPPVTVTITEPSDATTNVATSTEIIFTTERATEVTVELADLDGTSIDGELDEEDSSWLPAVQLGYDTTYVATVTAVGPTGETTVQTSTFTTMPEPEKLVRVSSFIGDDQVIGVALPIIINFGREIPEELRADVERRMTVRTEPAQEGTWHWVTPTEVHYRPQEFWEKDTQINYRIATGGLPMGDEWYGGNDLTVAASVGDAVIMTVDNATKTMTVERDGEVLRTIPVSLGKRSTPSSSGILMIMEKHRKTVFDTREELSPEEAYVLDIEYAQRLTYTGEFIHAAPWSVDDQGERNVSHGCVNMSDENAEWLFNLTKTGDPVIVEGTERQVAPGEGWTDWNMSWERYLEGSALYES